MEICLCVNQDQLPILKNIWQFSTNENQNLKDGFYAKNFRQMTNQELKEFLDEKSRIIQQSQLH
jgi:hypothetical protein